MISPPLLFEELLGIGDQIIESDLAGLDDLSDLALPLLSAAALNRRLCCAQRTDDLTVHLAVGTDEADGEDLASGLALEDALWQRGALTGHDVSPRRR